MRRWRRGSRRKVTDFLEGLVVVGVSRIRALSCHEYWAFKGQKMANVQYYEKEKDHKYSKHAEGDFDVQS